VRDWRPARQSLTTTEVLIAAVALQEHATLLTSNRKHYPIPGLNALSPVIARSTLISTHRHSRGHLVYFPWQHTQQGANQLLSKGMTRGTGCWCCPLPSPLQTTTPEPMLTLVRV
jgi:hypothetical protein